MALWDLVDVYLRRSSSGISLLKLLNGASGICLAVAYWINTPERHPVLAMWLFAFGVVGVLMTTALLFIFDQGPTEQLTSLHSAEGELVELEEGLEEVVQSREIVLSWLALSKLLQELVDQAIKSDTINRHEKERLFELAVEFIAEYRSRLFGIGDDYLNISVYEYMEGSGLLECVGCYRSRPSDARGPHRSWASGTGHVGKAFELQEELICSDATQPDVSSWISAPPTHYREDDEELYVSLASIPIALDADNPRGVLIMTSNKPKRFVSGNEQGAVNAKERIAVDALQDVAAQLAQLLILIQTKFHEGDTSHDRDQDQNTPQGSASDEVRGSQS
jgi:hypothetical protein